MPLVHVEYILHIMMHFWIDVIAFLILRTVSHEIFIEDLILRLHFRRIESEKISENAQIELEIMGFKPHQALVLMVFR